MNKFENISNTELSMIIDEWIRGERNRLLMKRRLIDCITLEKLGEEFSLSVQQVATIVSKSTKIISTKTIE